MLMACYVTATRCENNTDRGPWPERRVTHGRKAAALLKEAWESAAEAEPVGLCRLHRSSPRGYKESAFSMKETAHAKI